MFALIINYNRLKLPVAMADWLAAHGVDPVFIDNKSDYPPLLEYYKETKYAVMTMAANYGHIVVWDVPHILPMLGITERYIVTDPDIDLTGVPDDFLSVMNKGLNKYPQYDKCGLSLEINDLPNSEEGNFIKVHEAKYWQRPLDSCYFEAATDTTFALYREGVTKYSHSAIRTNRPYVCKHVPWYYEDMSKLPEDERYYFKTAGASSSGKIRLTK